MNLNNIDNFTKEIQEYSIEELELIYETQKDLYSEEEMQLIKMRIKELSQLEKEEFEKNLPKEIICEKCEGPNSFVNDSCIFCGTKLEKDKYYNREYYEKSYDIGNENKFIYVISFLIPLIGFILGAILLSKNSSDEKSLGKDCIMSGITSIIIGSVIWILYINFIFNI